MKNPPPLRAEQIDPAFVADLASVLDSVQKLFNNEADYSTNGMDVRGQLQDCFEHGAAEGGDPNLVFDRAHQIMKKGLQDWLGSLQKVAAAFVTKLATMARNHPEWVTEDPASWARSRTKEMLDRWLDGVLDCVWFPQIVIWFHDAWGGPDLDCTQYDSWCAPTWVEERRENDPASLDERMTPERTEKLFRDWRHTFDINLDRGLEEAELTARVNLALQPAPPEPSNQRQASVELSTKAALNYPRSAFNRAISLLLARKPTATDKDLCSCLDDEGMCELPGGWANDGNRSFVSAYRDPVSRAKIHSAISKVRKDMKDARILA